MTNSAAPDQLACQKLADLDLHCLQKQDISGFSRTRVNRNEILYWFFVKHKLQIGLNLQ